MFNWENRDGRLKDVHAHAEILSLKISWIRKLKDSKFHPWKVLANHLLSKVGSEAIFHANYPLQKNLDKERMIFHYFIKKLFWLGKNFPSLKILLTAKSAHDLCGMISLFNQNLRVFIMILYSLRAS